MKQWYEELFPDFADKYQGESLTAETICASNLVPSAERTYFKLKMLK
jgi:hypothetical protein